MASLEGIPSLFPAQPHRRSPKLRIYEYLFLWNQRVDQVVATLRRMEKFSFADKHSLRCSQAEMEEVRAGVNADFVESMSEYERRDQGRFWKQRRAYEKALEDLDDVYFEVEEREEQRRKQGLPPRLGIVPHSATAPEKEEGIEAVQRRKKRHSTKRRKPTAKAKSTARKNRHA